MAEPCAHNFIRMYPLIDGPAAERDVAALKAMGVPQGAAICMDCDALWQREDERRRVVCVVMATGERAAVDTVADAFAWMDEHGIKSSWCRWEGLDAVRWEQVYEEAGRRKRERARRFGGTPGHDAQA